jgi:activator of HSP90 ATPase
LGEGIFTLNGLLILINVPNCGTRVLHECHKRSKSALQARYKLQECCKSFTRVLQEFYKGVARVLQACYKYVTSMLQVCYKHVTSTTTVTPTHGPAVAKGEERGKRHEARGKRQEARGKRQKARKKRQEASTTAVAPTQSPAIAAASCFLPLAVLCDQI